MLMMFEFLINGVNYTAIQENDYFYYNIEPVGDSNTTYDWQNIYATDVVGLFQHSTRT